jgi:hypothetical protein
MTDHLKKQLLTAEEKGRWAEMFHDTWRAIAPDADEMCRGRSRASLIVEMVCDANRVQMYGGMTDAEYKFLGACYHRGDFQKWARGVLNY